jgi:hypothetical protein
MAAMQATGGYRDFSVNVTEACGLIDIQEHL